MFWEAVITALLLYLWGKPGDGFKAENTPINGGTRL